MTMQRPAVGSNTKMRRRRKKRGRKFQATDAVEIPNNQRHGNPKQPPAISCRIPSPPPSFLTRSGGQIRGREGEARRGGDERGAPVASSKNSGWKQGRRRAQWVSPGGNECARRKTSCEYLEHSNQYQMTFRPEKTEKDDHCD